MAIFDRMTFRLLRRIEHSAPPENAADTVCFTGAPTPYARRGSPLRTGQAVPECASTPLNRIKSSPVCSLSTPEGDSGFCSAPAPGPIS